MRKLALLLGVLAAATFAACSIGPKQDDPLQDPAFGDTGVYDANTADDSGFRTEDTAAPSTNPEVGDEAGSGIDAASDAAGDAKSETCPDGGTPLTAMGPWDDEKKCWKGTVVFECASGGGGLTVMTCFVKISTGELYLAPTTRIPSGPDYRLCTAEERSSADKLDICTK